MSRLKTSSPDFRFADRILECRFWSRTNKSLEPAFKLVSVEDVSCVLHHVQSRARLKRSWGQVWPEKDLKTTKTQIQMSWSLFECHLGTDPVP